MLADDLQRDKGNAPRSSMTALLCICRTPVSLDKAWVQVLADDLQRDKDKAARSNLRKYVSQTLAAIKQVLLFPLTA